MDATYGSATAPRPRTPIAERMNDILRAEIEGGALANIVAATRVWSAYRRDLALPEAARRLVTEFGGVLDTVLDLIAPTKQPLAEESAASVPVLRARHPGAPGGRAEIRTAVVNDGPSPVEVGFVCSDLVAEPQGSIAAACLRFHPARLRVPPGGVADVVIDLHVPRDADPGLYQGRLVTTDRGGSPALVMFRVGLDDYQEAAVAS